MRWVIWAIAGLAAVWSGYWFVAAAAKERALAQWFDARRAEGWLAEHGAIEVAGFPYRFDTRLSQVMLADPDTGVAWEIPELQIVALAYRPNHVIAFWPERQILGSSRERVEMRAGAMQASLVLLPGTALELDRATVTLEAVGLESDAGWQAGLADGLVAIRRVEGREATYDIAFDASDAVLPGPLRARLDPSGLLPDAVGTLRLSMTTGFAAPLDRRLIEERRPPITEIRLDDLNAIWGRLELRAAGELRADADGFPEGEITVKAKNWREMLRIGTEAGFYGDTTARMLESGLEFLAGLSGHPDTIDAPLTFRAGRVSFGPIGLGRAPRLVLP